MKFKALTPDQHRAMGEEGAEAISAKILKVSFLRDTRERANRGQVVSSHFCNIHVARSPSCVSLQSRCCPFRRYLAAAPFRAQPRTTY